MREAPDDRIVAELDPLSRVVAHARGDHERADASSAIHNADRLARAASRTASSPVSSTSTTPPPAAPVHPAIHIAKPAYASPPRSATESLASIPRAKDHGRYHDCRRERGFPHPPEHERLSTCRPLQASNRRELDWLVSPSGSGCSLAARTTPPSTCAGAASTWANVSDCRTTKCWHHHQTSSTRWR